MRVGNKDKVKAVKPLCLEMGKQPKTKNKWPIDKNTKYKLACNRTQKRGIWATSTKHKSDKIRVVYGNKTWQTVY